ncbi:unnamed protein product [Didymodactylos carnosus]|uniref:Alcohol dehydrogenase n=1 Tax=Didymodactylos carnosus TaxID=1234261 RepID=A0A815JQG0_9BILA|nr:unnamed protein product [Didymodactylos carnosus]CAF1382906.1 unnamed protein product [Didymodactylos carnosus]CAF4057252.1 unnamed protein product [Didymodactylos carnosus]CAF4278108.1 unnamed protein product [Didymodactylos carnosus]
MSLLELDLSKTIDKRWAHQNALSSFATVHIEPPSKPIQMPQIHPKTDPTVMNTVLEWHGAKSIKVNKRPRPLITEPKDAIIHVTSTTVCGSDLHLYHNEFAGLEKNDILGHECMGIIESVGSGVKNVKVGDRVVVSAIISCGECQYCTQGLFSLCDYTNPSKEMEKNYGHHIAGVFGYSHLLGGYDGCQAEYVRVPFADVNTLKITSDVKDEKVLFLSDIICTGWQATVLGGVQEGTTVAVWGCGPVGLMSVMWSRYRGAKKIVAIDCYEERLEKARSQGAETINFSKTDTLKTLQQLIPGGPDICIDAAGFRFAKGVAHQLQRGLQLETDTPEILREAIMACRKGGTISVVGDYYSTANQFPIGALMEKGLTIRCGQLHAQSYWHDLLKIVEDGKIDPTFVITHTMPLEQGDDAYKMFDEKEDGAIKIVLKTKAAK